MNIRTRLFIFIPLLVILMNLVSYFIFDSGRKVQDSYNLMMDRILLYQQLSHETQETLRHVNRLLTGLDLENPYSYLTHMIELERLAKELSRLKRTENNSLSIKNYQNMISTFLAQTKEAIASVEQTGSNYVHAYYQAEKTAEYIREDGYELVDLELNYYRPIYQDIIDTTSRLNQLGVQLFVTTTLLSIFFALWISTSITDPIRRLVLTAKQISKGNLQTKAPEMQTNDEIAILCRTFNHMLDNLQNLMAKNMESLEKDRLVKEFELKALQSQINPHFLFNTLNVVAKLAYIEGAEKTSDLAVSMSKLLRYNLQKLDQAVTLRDEVEHAKEYFAIQKARFRDRVTFVTDIEERVLDQAVPCLSLQPILENAFMHGIEGMEEGAVLTLSIQPIEEGVQIEITDNGVGMPDEVRERLLSEDPGEIPRSGRGHSTGLGTRNVFKRLHLFYDGNESIDIRSAKQQGTTVTFRLPRRTNTDYVSADAHKLADAAEKEG
ncbi:sensor histidine kinase [Paenibacillus turpanensis]|uniref:sensor histidine kinase n=1 Tax=Paenibacillus turpanensis TaxID=2689078 RepID=UPI001408E2DA|nr:sensor histidine kinase [Paenibacillus turpanensis]